MKAMKWIGFAMLLCLCQSAFAEEAIRITNGEWPPYLSETLKHYGVASHIVSEAFALEEVKVEYGFFPWSRSIKLARMGKWDGTAIWSRNQDRAKDFHFSEPVIRSKWVFFHLKTTEMDWKSVEDLKDYHIGATLEYEYDDAFETAEKSGRIKVARVPKDEQNFEKLLKGRIDIFPQDLDVGYEMIHNLFPEEQRQMFTHHPKPVKDDLFHLLLSKKVERNKEMLGRFNRGLEKLRQSGKIEQYLEASRKGAYKK